MKITVKISGKNHLLLGLYCKDSLGNETPLEAVTCDVPENLSEEEFAELTYTLSKKLVRGLEEIDLYRGESHKEIINCVRNYFKKHCLKKKLINNPYFPHKKPVGEKKTLLCQ